MEDDITKKQEYLRVEIIDGNYSPELFTEFLSSLKGFLVNAL